MLNHKHIFPGFTGNKKWNEDKHKNEERSQHLSRKDTSDPRPKTTGREEKENCHKLISSDKSSSKKMRLLGKYFHVHKKLFIPLPGLFSRNRLYKAQSCSSLSRDKIALSADAALRCRQRAVSVIRTSLGDEEIASEKRNSLVLSGSRPSVEMQLVN